MHLRKLNPYYHLVCGFPCLFVLFSLFNTIRAYFRCSATSLLSKRVSSTAFHRLIRLQQCVANTPRIVIKSKHVAVIETCE